MTRKKDPVGTTGIITGITTGSIPSEHMTTSPDPGSETGEMTGRVRQGGDRAVRDQCPKSAELGETGRGALIVRDIVEGMIEVLSEVSSTVAGKSVDGPNGHDFIEEHMRNSSTPDG